MLSPVISAGFSMPMMSSRVGARSARRPPSRSCASLREGSTRMKGTLLVVCAVKG